MEIDTSKLNKRGKGRPSLYTDEQVETIRKLHEKGYSQTSIGAATGIPQRTISTLLRRK